MVVDTRDDVLLWLKDRLRQMEEKYEQAKTVVHKVHYGAVVSELRAIIFELDGNKG